MKQTYDNQYDSCRNFASQKMLGISKKKKKLRIPVIVKTSHIQITFLIIFLT